MSVNHHAEQNELNYRKQRISNRFQEIKANLSELERHLHMRAPSSKQPADTPNIAHYQHLHHTVDDRYRQAASPTSWNSPSHPGSEHTRLSSHKHKHNNSGHQQAQYYLSTRTSTSPDSKHLDWSTSTGITHATAPYRPSATTHTAAHVGHGSRRIGQFDVASTRTPQTRTGAHAAGGRYPEAYPSRKSISPIRQLAYYCEQNFSQQASPSRRSTHDPTPPGDLLAVCRQRRDWLKAELKIAESKLRIAEATKKAELEVTRVLGPQVKTGSREVSREFMRHSVPLSWQTDRGYDQHQRVSQDLISKEPHLTHKDRLRETLSKLTVTTEDTTFGQQRLSNTEQTYYQRPEVNHQEEQELATQEQQQELDRHLQTYEQLIEENLRLKQMLVSGSHSEEVSTGKKTSK